MHEDVLTSILSFLESRPAQSQKHLINYVVQLGSGDNPDGAKPIVRLIVELLSVASCFQVNIRQDGTSQLTQLKSEFQNYESLRCAYDSQIIQMIMKDGKYFFVFFFCSSYIFIC